MEKDDFRSSWTLINDWNRTLITRTTRIDWPATEFENVGLSPQVIFSISESHPRLLLATNIAMKPCIRIQPLNQALDQFQPRPVQTCPRFGVCICGWVLISTMLMAPWFSRRSSRSLSESPRHVPPRDMTVAVRDWMTTLFAHSSRERNLAVSFCASPCPNCNARGLISGGSNIPLSLPS